MHIECRSCPVRDRHCADCMVTALLEMPAPRADMTGSDLAPDENERRALTAFVSAGLIGATQAQAARAMPEPRRALRVTG